MTPEKKLELIFEATEEYRKDTLGFIGMFTVIRVLSEPNSEISEKVIEWAKKLFRDD